MTPEAKDGKAPDKKDEKEEPKIGVFVCECGGNISGKVRVDEVVEFAKTLPNVEVAAENFSMCSSVGVDMVKNAIKTAWVSTGSCSMTGSSGLRSRILAHRPWPSYARPTTSRAKKRRRT